MSTLKSPKPRSLRSMIRASSIAIGLAVFAPGVGIAADAVSQTPPAIAAPATAPAIGVAYSNDRLSVVVLGPGPDVILIPGFASSRAVWQATADRLSATHRVHLVQMAGFAGEPWVHGESFFVQPAIDALAAYIQEAGLDRPAIIGHSMGAMSALMLAQQHPDRVGKVMSVDSLPFLSAMFSPAMTVDMARPMAVQAASSILTATDEEFLASQTATARSMSRDPATQAALVEWSLASDKNAIAMAIGELLITDLRPGLATMTTPVWALYASDADGGAPAALADSLWAREYAPLPGVRLIRVDESRHFSMADQPERFAQIVDEFLK